MRGESQNDFHYGTMNYGSIGRAAQTCMYTETAPCYGSIAAYTEMTELGDDALEMNDTLAMFLSAEDEKKFQQFWRLAAAEESEELTNSGGLDGFYDAPEEVHGFDATPDSGVHDFSSLDPEQRAKLEEEWKTELARVEDEIMTLRHVLTEKIKQAQDLKRKLGITAWKEFRDDMGQGIKSIQESTAYQKTSHTIRSAGEKTSTALGSLGATVSKKLVDVKNSTAFKSFEEKVGSAYTNVKTKISSSRSNSVNSFEESLNNMEARSPNAASPATSPTIPEDKPLT